ncbi:MAG: hypothetical protein J6W54_04100 [Fibrobacter sp.]|uniref:hypothetical protein n=1 Tax=Fibrobacter sp. TaxID=35828 RepID=UPI001B253F1B|nr:hypothetical protein [Fibrobacter sp.]MBO7060263.1 hypothetical protein [Fibrobacter sp.]
MDNAKNDKKDNKVKKGEELLAVLKEGLSDHAKILENQAEISKKLDDMAEMLRRALPPSPGRFTRI